MCESLSPIHSVIGGMTYLSYLLSMTMAATIDASASITNFPYIVDVGPPSDLKAALPKVSVKSQTDLA